MCSWAWCSVHVSSLHYVFSLVTSPSPMAFDAIYKLVIPNFTSLALWCPWILDIYISLLLIISIKCPTQHFKLQMSRVETLISFQICFFLNFPFSEPSGQRPIFPSHFISSLSSLSVLSSKYIPILTLFHCLPYGHISPFFLFLLPRVAVASLPASTLISIQIPEWSFLKNRFSSWEQF